MHTTQHSTIHRRATMPVVSHAIGIEVTDQDILNAIAQIAKEQSTGFVMIAKLAFALGFNADDRDWLIGTLKVLDTEGHILLSPVERPQNLPVYQACWYVRNGSGIPCHEVAVNSAPDPSRRIAPLLSRTAPAHPVWRQAEDSSTHNPRMQQRRISELVESAAETLFGNGSHPHTRVRVCHVEQNSTGRAA